MGQNPGSGSKFNVFGSTTLSFSSRNFEAETRRLEEGEPEPPGYSRSKKKTLEELFKPPLDIMHQVPRDNYCTVLFDSCRLPQRLVYSLLVYGLYGTGIYHCTVNFLIHRCCGSGSVPFYLYRHPTEFNLIHSRPYMF